MNQEQTSSDPVHTPAKVHGIPSYGLGRGIFYDVEVDEKEQLRRENADLRAMVEKLKRSLTAALEAVADSRREAK